MTAYSVAPASFSVLATLYVSGTTTVESWSQLQ
jgi:hypothetical protein